MPRDKKIVHRSTSDVEETSDTEDAISDPENERLIGKPDQKPKSETKSVFKIETKSVIKFRGILV